MVKNVLITGATGCLGSEIFFRLAKNSQDTIINLLVRDSNRRSAQEKFDSLISKLPSNIDKSRFKLIAGDCSESKFGINSGLYDSLASSLDQIYHCAASVSFTQKIEAARKSNVQSTKEVIDLALKGNKPQLNYVSTAFVAGDTEDVVYPSQLSVDNDFKNTYEQSKAEAEAIVREYSSQIPTHIYRPSMVIGDSKTGMARSFNTSYVPAKLMLSGVLKVVPGSPAASLDLVPVDYVANSILAISQIDPGKNACYHLCAGVDRESSVKEFMDLLFCRFVELSSSTFQYPEFCRMDSKMLEQIKNAATARIKSLEAFFGKQVELISRIFPYFLYMDRNPRFETNTNIVELAGKLEAAPIFSSYSNIIFDYWLQNVILPGRSNKVLS